MKHNRGFSKNSFSHGKASLTNPDCSPSIRKGFIGYIIWVLAIGYLIKWYLQAQKVFNGSQEWGSPKLIPKPFFLVKGFLDLRVDFVKWFGMPSTFRLFDCEYYHYIHCYEFIHTPNFVWAPLIIKDHFAYYCGQIVFLIHVFSPSEECDPS
jgi:hypothetical protein